MRTGSGQSDSSGFIELDEESETTASFARDSSKDSVMVRMCNHLLFLLRACYVIDHTWVHVYWILIHLEQVVPANLICSFLLG